MRNLMIALSGDIVSDRRMIRCAKTLAEKFNIKIICRKIFPHSIEIKDVEISRWNCIFNSGFFFYAELNLRIFFKLLFSKNDLVLSVDYDTIMASALAKKIKSFKLIFDAHEYYEESIEIVNREKIQRIWKSIGRNFVPMANRHYTVSSSIADIYSSLYEADFKVVRNVPPLMPQVTTYPNPEKYIILYQGVLNEGRMLEMLVESASFLDDKYEIQIVGDGDIAQDLKATAGKKVTFLGWVEPDALKAITGKAALAYNLLDPSSQSYYYSLANKFFDYLHSGVPSLNNRFPEYEQINARYNCCFNIDVNNAKDLASYIMTVISDRESLSEKSKNAKLASQDLCWEKEATKLHKIFENI